MDVSLLFIGVVIGLAMAAPLGPVNLIVIRAALNHSIRAALLSGLGAVLADALMASIAAFGLREIERFIVDYTRPIQLIGGVLLVVLGIKTARKHHAASELSSKPVPAKFALTFFLTVTNPGTALGFLAIFSAMSGMLQLNSAPYRSTTVVLGVVLGGALWWLLISSLIAKLKSSFSVTTLDRINRWSGILVASFGLVLLMQAAG